MPDMSVALVWVPSGAVDATAGMREVEAKGDQGLRLAIDANDDIWDWGNDLLNDIARYEREPSSHSLDEVTPTRAAEIFVRALSLAADPSIADRGLIDRIPLSGSGVILAAGGELGGQNPASFATLYAATVVFPTVAEKMGAVPPTNWTLTRE